MDVTTSVFLSESDIRKIITKHLTSCGYELIGELEINVQSKKDIPAGATAGDVVGINATVEVIIDKDIYE